MEIALIFGLVLPQSAAAKIQSSPDAAATIPNATAPRSNLPKNAYLAALENIKSPSPATRRQAIEFFAQTKNAASIPALIEALSDPDASVRSADVHALGLLRAKSASSKISQMLVKDKSPEVRQHAAVALVYLADPASVPALISAISDPVEGVRYSAMRILGALRAPAAAPALIKSLKNLNPNIRQIAALALGEIGSPTALPALENLTLDPHSAVRQAAISALGSIGGARVVPLLTKALKDPVFSVRLQAALSLARLGNPKGAKIALDGLKQNNVFLRHQSVVILGLIGGKSALLALKTFTKKEEDPTTKSAAQFAKSQIMARLGIDPASLKSAKTTTPVP